MASSFFQWDQSITSADCRGTEEPHCIAARGGIYTPSQSTIWSPLGIWQLSDAYLGYDENGEYGLGTIAKDSAVNASFSMSKALIVSINTTDCYVGQFGLGIIEGNFNNEVVDSPLTQAVEGAGWIPSYSYGFTAGASYSAWSMSWSAQYQELTMEQEMHQHQSSSGDTIRLDAGQKVPSSPC